MEVWFNKIHKFKEKKNTLVEQSGFSAMHYTGLDGIQISSSTLQDARQEQQRDYINLKLIDIHKSSILRK